MSQSLSKVYVHIVFSTKSREIHLDEKIEHTSFQDEFRAFLKKYKVDYDERYV